MSHQTYYYSITIGILLLIVPANYYMTDFTFDLQRILLKVTGYMIYNIISIILLTYKIMILFQPHKCHEIFFKHLEFQHSNI